MLCVWCWYVRRQLSGRNSRRDGAMRNHQLHTRCACHAAVPVWCRTQRITLRQHTALFAAPVCFDDRRVVLTDNCHVHHVLPQVYATLTRRKLFASWLRLAMVVVMVGVGATAFKAGRSQREVTTSPPQTTTILRCGH